MSLTKLASFLRDENEATVFESLYVSILAKMFSSLPKQIQENENTRFLAIHQTPPPKQPSHHTCTQTRMHAVAHSP